MKVLGTLVISKKVDMFFNKQILELGRHVEIGIVKHVGKFTLSPSCTITNSMKPSNGEGSSCFPSREKFSPKCSSQSSGSLQNIIHNDCKANF